MLRTMCVVTAALCVMRTGVLAQSTPDIGAFLELSFDSRRVPAANLAPGQYEAQPPLACNPFDDLRTAFLAGQ